MKRLVYFAGLLLLLVGCGVDKEPLDQERGETKTVIDVFEREVEIPEKVESILTLGNATRQANYMGLAEIMVGNSGFPFEEINPMLVHGYATRYYWKDEPIVGASRGGGVEFYPEEIIKAKPDIIIAAYDLDMVQDLENQTGIPVVAVPVGNVLEEDYNQAFRIIGQATGTEARAEELIAFIGESLADLGERTVDIKDRFTVLSAAANFRGTHGIEGVRVHDLAINAVNGDNLAAGLYTGEASTMEVDKEQILAWNPDFIFCDLGGVELVKKDEAENPAFYEELDAYMDKRIFQHPSSTYNYGNLEISLANAYYIGKTIYPDRFEDVDPVEKLNEIVKFFLGVDNYYAELESIGASYGEIDFDR